MKQKDIALILIIIVVSAAISLFVSNSVFSSPKNRQQSVQVVQVITTDFPSADSRYFNSNAFDPAKLITIGQNSNSNPFSGSSQ